MLLATGFALKLLSRIVASLSRGRLRESLPNDIAERIGRTFFSPVCHVSASGSLDFSQFHRRTKSESRSVEIRDNESRAEIALTRNARENCIIASLKQYDVFRGKTLRRVKIFQRYTRIGWENSLLSNVNYNCNCIIRAVETTKWNCIIVFNCVSRGSLRRYAMKVLNGYNRLFSLQISN